MGGQPSSDCSSSLGPVGQSPEVYTPGLAIVQVDGMADKGTRDPTVTSLITLSASWTLEIMFVNSRCGCQLWLSSCECGCCVKHDLATAARILIPDIRTFLTLLYFLIVRPSDHGILTNAIALSRTHIHVGTLTLALCLPQ